MGGTHETCQKCILDTTVFNNSRQAFSNPETHFPPWPDFQLGMKMNHNFIFQV